MARSFKQPPVPKGTTQQQLDELRRYLAALVREVEITFSAVEKKIREVERKNG